MKTYNKTCEVCQSKFETLNDRSRTCSKPCANELKFNRFEEKNCAHCGITFKPKSGKAACCSAKCTYEKREAVQRIKIVEDSKSKTSECVECAVCGFKGESLQSHLYHHHGLTLDQYYIQYNKTLDDVLIKSVRQRLSNNVSGVKNVWAKHGGKLSMYSKDYQGYSHLSDDEKAVAALEQSRKMVEKTHQAGNNNTTVSYYLKRGLTEEQAKKLLSDRQATFTKEKLVAKHGDEKGKFIWKLRQEKWQNTLNMKPLEERIEINKKKLYRSGGVSKVSVQFFRDLDAIGKWSESGGEEIVVLNDDRGSVRKVDFMSGSKIIEFFGTYWHADPRKYSDDHLVKYPRKGEIRASVIREKDEIYLNYLKDLGYEVLVVWEHDYKNNKDGTIQQCREFLNI